jgi:hypothetical protein
MSEMGKTQIVITFTVGPDDVATGDCLFESHGKSMTGHPRAGDMALRSYSISKGPELANPLDPSSSPTGDTIFVLDEVYESTAGVAAHWKLAQETWQDLGPFLEWSTRAKVYTLHSGTVGQALW